MPRYVVELEGTVELEADDDLHAEDLAMAAITGDEWFGTKEHLRSNIDVDFIVNDVKELD